LSQLLLAVPMCLLYELGLLIARFYVPKSVDDESDDIKDGESKGSDTQATV
jgi:sec-independent protein translocase protein TatC